MSLFPGRVDVPNPVTGEVPLRGRAASPPPYLRRRLARALLQDVPVPGHGGCPPGSGHGWMSPGPSRTEVPIPATGGGPASLSRSLAATVSPPAARPRATSGCPRSRSWRMSPFPVMEDVPQGRHEWMSPFPSRGEVPIPAETRRLRSSHRNPRATSGCPQDPVTGGCAHSRHGAPVPLRGRAAATRAAAMGREPGGAPGERAETPSEGGRLVGLTSLDVVHAGAETLRVAQVAFWFRERQVLVPVRRHVRGSGEDREPNRLRGISRRSSKQTNGRAGRSLHQTRAAANCGASAARGARGVRQVLGDRRGASRSAGSHPRSREAARAALWRRRVRPPSGGVAHEPREGAPGFERRPPPHDHALELATKATPLSGGALGATQRNDGAGIPERHGQASSRSAVERPPRSPAQAYGADAPSRTRRRSRPALPHQAARHEFSCHPRRRRPR